MAVVVVLLSLENQLKVVQTIGEQLVVAVELVVHQLVVVLLVVALHKMELYMALLVMLQVLQL